MERLPTRIPEPLSEFARRLSEIVGPARADEILRSMDGPRRAGYWLNPLRGGVALAGSQAIAALPGCWSVAAARREELVAADGAADGGIYPINPSSVLAVQALAGARGHLTQSRIQIGPG